MAPKYQEGEKRYQRSGVKEATKFIGGRFFDQHTFARPLSKPLPDDAEVEPPKEKRDCERSGEDER